MGGLELQSPVGCLLALAGCLNLAVDEPVGEGAGDERDRVVDDHVHYCVLSSDGVVYQRRSLSAWGIVRYSLMPVA